MVGIQVFANGRIGTGGPFALPTYFRIFAFHVVHIGGRASKVTDSSVEIRHPGNVVQFLQDGLF